MRRCFTIFCLTLLLNSTAPAQPDSIWARTFGGSGADSAFCIQPTADGGFIAAGSANSYGAVWSDIVLLKTDADGDTLWTKVYGGMDNDFGRCVHQTSDGGYIVAGGTFSYGNGAADLYLIKTDPLGDTLWTFTYGDTDDEVGCSVVEADDGGFVIAGYYYGYSSVSYYYLLIKVDSGGAVQWVNPISNWGLNGANSVEKTLDGGYISTGYTGLGYITGGDVFLVKIDDLGHVVWDKEIGGSDIDIGNSVRQTRDGGFIVAGNTNSFGAGYSDFYLIRTNSSGDTIWTRTYGGLYEDLGQSVIECPEGGFIIAGTTFSYGGLYGDIMLVKTDANGDSLWSMIIGSGNTEEGAHCVQLAQDGGFVVAGYTDSPGNPDLYLMRFQNENPVFLTLVPSANPINIPLSGGDLNFRVEMFNTRQTVQVFDIWSQVTFPTGRILLPAALRTGLVLQAGEHIVREMSLPIPASAPGGNYYFQGCAGIYPDSIYSSNRLFFVKLPGGNAVPRRENNPIGAISTVLSAFPNPFNQRSLVSFTLQREGAFELAVYDISGREVAKLAEGYYPAGAHSAVWDASGLSSGIYFARLDAGGIQHTMKLLLVK